MDVLWTQPARVASCSGTVDGGPELGSSVTAFRDLVERRRKRLIEVLVRLLGGGDAGGLSSATNRNGLLIYTAFSIVLGISLVVVSTVTWPLWPAIDPGFQRTALDGEGGGLILWLLFGLIGSTRILRTRDGGSMTFHMPFIGAAMILGGPTAGAWVATLSTIERRELESQPWYGILANHFVLAIGAVAGGVTTALLLALLGRSGTAVFAAGLAGAIVLAAVSTVIASVTLVLRDGLKPRALVDVLLGQVGRVSALEVALVIAFALSYLYVAWWAPLVISLFVLVLWDNHPLPPDDRLTGLLARETFLHRLDSALGRIRRGIVRGGAVLLIDLDRFKEINTRYGYAVGDDVLREVGHRIREYARRPYDLAGRLGGDEDIMALLGIPDAATAMRRAELICKAIAEPIPTSVGPMSVSASIGVVYLESWGGLPSVQAILRQANIALFLAKPGDERVHLYDPNEPIPFDGPWSGDNT